MLSRRSSANHIRGKASIVRQRPRQRPRQDSNLRTRLRRPMLYPLSYEGGGWRIPGRKPRPGRSLHGDRWWRGHGPLWARRRVRDGVVSRPGAPKSAGESAAVAVSRRRVGWVRCRRWRWSGQAVDHEGVAEEVEVLAARGRCCGSAEPEGVFDVPVDGFGVVAATERPAKSGSVGWDGPDVLGPVELPRGVVGVAVEPDGDGGSGTVGELVVVVPTTAIESPSARPSDIPLMARDRPSRLALAGQRLHRARQGEARP